MKSVKEQILNSLGWFLAKLKTTFTQKSDIINNCVSTATDAPLSAAQGKALSDSISALNSDLSQQISELNSNLTNKVDNADLPSASVNYANSAGSANAVAWGNVSGRPNVDNMVLALRNFTDFNNAPDGVSMFDVTQDIANSPGVNSGYLFQNTVQVAGYTLKYQIVINPWGKVHYTRTQWYDTWGDWNDFDHDNFIYKNINAEIPNRTEQRYGNIAVVTTDYQGVNAVSGFDNCLCLHMAVDIRDAANNHLSTMGFISGSQYYYYDISRLNLGMNVNNNGTCAITGGDPAFIKQTFILIPQVDYSQKS